MRDKKELTFIQHKIVYSCFIVLIYILGRQLPIPWVERSAVDQDLSVVQALTEGLMGRANGGNSVLTLGIGPMISASIAMQIIQSFLPRSYKQRAQMTLKKVMMVLCLAITVVRALTQASHMTMIATDPMGISHARLFTMFALIGGSGFTIWLGSRNKKYGLGGTSLLILVNIADSFRMAVMPYFVSAASGAFDTFHLVVMGAVILYCILLTFLIIVFQKAEVRIPVNRVMIHNVYADKNYMAISLTPAGSMPVMFALTVFSLPMYLTRFVEMFNQEQAAAMHRLDLFFDLNFYEGFWVYMFIYAMLTLVFAFVNVDPGQIAEGFLKSGDTIPGVRSGKQTSLYLTRYLLRCVVISIVVLGVGIGIPLLAHIEIGLDQKVAMLPTTLMILTGVVLSLIEEYTTLKTFEYYKPFL